jgi:hypothetical protein
MKEQITYTKGYKYQLRDSHFTSVAIYPNEMIQTPYITLNSDGLLIIKKGYAWDGASGTTVDTKSAMRGPLVHDALYQLMRMELLDQKYRKQADIELYKRLIEDGMFKLRAKVWLMAVRKLASFAADPKNKKKTLTAP